MGCSRSLVTRLALALMSVSTLSSFPARAEQVLNIPGTSGYQITVAAQPGLVAVGVPDLTAPRVRLYELSGSTWVSGQVLEPTVVPNGQFWGSSIALGGDRMLVAEAAVDPSPPGSVHVFRRSALGWSEEQRLLPSDGVHYFGSGRLALAGDRAHVAASWAVPSGAGAIYVFRFDGTSWVEVQKVVGPRPVNDAFGEGADASAERLVVGAPIDSSLAQWAGAVYVFRWDTPTGRYVLEQQLFASDPSYDAEFGRRVAIDGDRILVAASEGGAGAAYVFHFDGSSWVEEQKLSPPTSGPGRFAESIDLQGEWAFVHRSTPAFDVHVYQRTGSSWSLIETLDGDLGFGGRSEAAPGVLAVTDDPDQVHVYNDYPLAVCNNGVDDDGDGLIDYGQDPVCASSQSDRENAKCQDGLDNDGDGKIDFDGGASRNGGIPLGIADPQCAYSPARDRETSAGSCGLGAELALAFLALSARRTVQRRTPAQ